MSILVLGGAGYVGSHAVYGLIDKGYNVVVFDNLETGYRESVHEKAKFYEGDMRNIDDLKKVFTSEPIDGVMHFAANSLVEESMTNPLKYYENNVGGAQVLLSVMKEFEVKNIIFSSTAAVYGESKDNPITENSLTNPTNTYGETKLAMEKMMKWCSKAHNISFVSLRYFNVAGARNAGGIGEAHNPETHLIPLVLQVPLGKRDFISIYGDDYDTNDGSCIRDYIHVEDLIDAHILALNYLEKNEASNIFNLGSSQGFSVKEVIDEARKITNHSIPSKILERRAGDPSTLIASSKKAREVLGWSPTRTSINQIIESAWKWHKSNPNGYEK
jgi:UDP-glucose 4-epimerase